MKLTLIRHLPTEFNQRNLLQGSIDKSICDISEENKKLIKDNIIRLKNINFDLIITSSMKRTIETAKAYGYYDIKISPLSNEINFGSFEGLSRDILINKYKFEWYNDMKKIPIGEKFDDFVCRVSQFIKTYKEYSNLLIFGHGAFLRALVAYSKSIKIEKMNNIIIGHNQILNIEINE